MKELILSLFALSCFAFSSNEDPTVTTYNYGHNGMELVARSKKGTVIISTFNSKMTIRQDIANNVYTLYVANKLENNKKVTVNGAEANVTGKCIIRKKKDLTAVDFYYEIVNWKNGNKEVYKRT
ncbi:MAG: hypothetical protein RL427_550 [Bacteroidota bacterium]|jgi:hypothetical protein